MTRCRFIVKESNYTEIVMSQEFETLSQPLMVEIVRRRQVPVVRPLADPQFDTSAKCTSRPVPPLADPQFDTSAKCIYVPLHPTARRPAVRHVSQMYVQLHLSAPSGHATGPSVRCPVLVTTGGHRS